MKTIFDRVDPIYLDHAARGVECATGACGHTSHQFSGAIILLLFAVITIITLKSRVSQ